MMKDPSFHSAYSFDERAREMNRPNLLSRSSKSDLRTFLNVTPSSARYLSGQNRVGSTKSGSDFIIWWKSPLMRVFAGIW